MVHAHLENPPLAKPRGVFPAGSRHLMKGSGEILMVEDSATDAELAIRAFRRAKIANPLKVAATGGAGFDYLFGTGACAGEGPTLPGLILLDLDLPDMTGLEFLRRLKRDERTRAIPVVVLSMSGSVPGILEATRLGAAHYIVKPIDFENFIRIATMLKLHVTVGAARDVPAVNGGASSL